MRRMRRRDIKDVDWQYTVELGFKARPMPMSALLIACLLLRY